MCLVSKGLRVFRKRTYKNFRYPIRYVVNGLWYGEQLEPIFLSFQNIVLPWHESFDGQKNQFFVLRTSYGQPKQYQLAKDFTFSKPLNSSIAQFYVVLK